MCIVVFIIIIIIFFNSHTSKSIFYILFFVVYVMVSPISNTMLKLHNSWIEFIIIITPASAQSAP